MEYKHIIKEYKEHTKGIAKRSETLFKAFGNVPEPTEEEMTQVYNYLKDRLVGRAQEEINLECAIEYVSMKSQDMLREGA
jgi:hypothetical protein